MPPNSSLEPSGTAAVVALSTAPSKNEGQRIADALLRERLAACVSVVPGVESQYWWEGNIESAGEVMLVIKTTELALPRLMERVEALHSYDVPEVLVLNVRQGSARYLKWLGEAVRTS